MGAPRIFVADPPSLIDRALRLVFRVAYPLVKQLAWRGERRHAGVGVLVWHGGEVLAIRHSYRPGLGIPGGHRRRSEPPEVAACRELAEEVGVAATPDQLSLFAQRGRSYLYELHLDAPPAVKPDGREVVQAMFLAPDEARARSRLLRRLLRDR